MRRLHWVAVAGAGIVLGCLLNVHPSTWAARPAAPADPAVVAQEKTVNQLKEINAQLKELHTLLCSGKVKVTVVVNADDESK